MRLSVVSAVLAALSACPSTWAEQSSDDVLQASGLRGGLVVQIGCGEGKLTAALRLGDSFVVQGLDADQANVEKARAEILALGKSGKVSADLFDGQHLPYVDNLVNLLVAEDLGKIATTEVMRVLCPGGVAYVKQNGSWSKTIKPWPAEIDEWSHYLHDPQGTSVSNDLLAGHPRGLRWTGGPYWSRAHDTTAGMQAMVSTAGRVFYVMDEGPVESIQLPSHYVLTARDAFNGTVLWKRPLHDWFNALYPLKSGPGWMPRRLVAVKDRVYIAPGVGQNLLCLDAATGKVLREYADTATTFELIISDGVMFAAVDPEEKVCDYDQQNPDCWKEQARASIKWAWTRDGGVRLLKAIGTEDGKLLWQQKAPVAPMSLTADDTKVCFYDGTSVVALSRRDGSQQWKADTVVMKELRTGYAGPRLVLGKDEVLFSPAGHIVGIDAHTGKILWSVDDKPPSGHFSLEDVFVLGDKVWVLGRGNNGVYLTYGLRDGQKLGTHGNPINSFYIHQRCYPGKATTRLLLPAMMGITVYDIDKDEWFNNHWVRSGCVYGLMPANGMVYTVPHACACYYQSKLNGFDALAPQPQSAESPPAEQRLVKGPAYGRWDEQEKDAAAQWPTFRHDGFRSGYAKTDVSADVRQAWKKHLGAKLSQPVVADGKLFTSAIDAHVIYALEATSGRELWHFVAGGRVDSSPTVYHGLVLFGCADGCVYALAASDGKLAWKFQAAPNDRKLMSYEQLESVWPLAGSVLVQDGQIYCVAGRSMFLDGGLRMVILNPKTGELVSENVMDDRVPGTERNLQDLLMGKHMPVAMPDILSGDGRYVYMKSQTFTPDGQRLRIKPQRPDTQYDEEVHLFSPTSFLDDSWHQRTYWIYGRAAGEGWAEFQFPPKRTPCGQIMCVDEKNVYAYGREAELMCNTTVNEYTLYSADQKPARKVGIPKLEGKWDEGKYSAENPLAPNMTDWKQLSRQPKEKLSALSYRWAHDQPEVIAKAMVLANDRLFVAGPRDVVDEKQFWGRSNEKAYQEKMAEQAAWLRGENGGVMQVYAKSDGNKLAEYKLEGVPAFDGLIAADGRLFMVTQDGSLICLQGQ